MKNWGAIDQRLPVMWHGCDYNPDQWLHDPTILDEDIRLMKLAGCNVMSIGIFAWTAIEPEEGRYETAWLDRVIDRLHGNGIFTILATPSGARPAWMAERHPEVLRVDSSRRRQLFGERHNHCPTSPVYRQKVQAVNAMLAGRYGSHPGVLLWHLSNEYGGECHCELCQEAFREWLKRRYGDDLDELNRRWWTSFWSHTYTSWSQIQSPSPIGEASVHGLCLDWRRFVTEQTADFMRAEIAPLKQAAPLLPVTTNLMGAYPGLDYWKLAPPLDIVSWDSYPCWHGTGDIANALGSWDPEGRDWRLASDIGFVHDLTRSLKAGRPFLLMESTPGMTNWWSVSKLKRPGMHMASSLQAVAHGSDSVQYFQWRSSRGSSEKLHSAVVGHAGHERTRVFGDVRNVGGVLSRLGDVVGTSVPAKAAIIFDWENRWALEAAQGPLNDGRKAYERTCKDHYLPLWSMGIAADVISMDCDLSTYDLVVAPMLYMVRKGVAERMQAFVEAGGTLVATYWSGIADETDLCFLGGFPGPLRTLLGIWAEEIDALYPPERNSLVMKKGNPLGLRGSYEVKDLCELSHCESAEALAVYGGDFYKGRPALTVNRFGRGKAYYIAARTEERFLSDLYGRIARECALPRALDAVLPEGVSARIRRDEKSTFLFLINFTPEKRKVRLGHEEWIDAVSGERAAGTIRLGSYGAKVFRRPTQ